MRVLITGHKGYIGSKLYSRVVDLGHDVTGIDLKDGQDVIDCLPDEDYDYVFHLAAIPRVAFSVENPSYTLKQNVYATSVLLQWAHRHKVKRVIFSSSAAVLGNGSEPDSPYGLHKLMSEQECRLYSRLYGLDTVCLRYYNVFSQDQEYGGSYSTVISAWIEMLKRGLPLRIDGDGTQSRDFIHVDDVVNANIFAMNHPEKFNAACFDVGTGSALSLNDVKKLVKENNKVDFIYGSARNGDVYSSIADTTGLKELGWSATINTKKAILDCFKIQGD